MFSRIHLNLIQNICPPAAFGLSFMQNIYGNRIELPISRVPVDLLFEEFKTVDNHNYNEEIFRQIRIYVSVLDKYSLKTDPYIFSFFFRESCPSSVCPAQKFWHKQTNSRNWLHVSNNRYCSVCCIFTASLMLFPLPIFHQ